MGDRLTENGESSQTSHRTYGDIFDELFPHYLLMGMTPEEYWDGESSLKPAYLKAYRMRVENEQRMADQNNWMMGQYIISVLQCVPLLVGGLNVKENTQLPQYPDKPLMEKAEEKKKEEVRKRNEEDQIMLAMAMMQARVEKFNRNFTQAQQAESVDTGQ